jgi:hypothetical protein
VIVALPAIAAAFLMVLTTKEPERGATEDALKVGGALPFLRSALGCAKEGYLALDAKTKYAIAVSGGFKHQCLRLGNCPIKRCGSEGNGSLLMKLCHLEVLTTDVVFEWRH